MKKLYLSLFFCLFFIGLKAQTKESKVSKEKTISLLCHEWKYAKTINKGKETKKSPYHEFYIIFTPYEKVTLVSDGKHNEMYWKYFEDGGWIDLNEHIIHTHNLDFTFMKLLSVTDKVLTVLMPNEEGDGLAQVFFTKVR